MAPVEALVVERSFAAPLARVWGVWVDRASLEQWFIPQSGPASWIEPPTLEAHPGGKIAIAVRSQGQDYRIRGAIVALEPLRSLRLRWSWDSDFPAASAAGDTNVFVELADSGTATQVRLRHEGFPCLQSRQAHLRGWMRCFDGIEALLRAHR